MLFEEHTTKRTVSWEELSEAQKRPYLKKAEQNLQEGTGQSLETVAKEEYDKNPLELLQG